MSRELLSRKLDKNGFTVNARRIRTLEEGGMPSTPDLIAYSSIGESLDWLICGKKATLAAGLTESESKIVHDLICSLKRNRQ